MEKAVGRKIYLKSKFYLFWSIFHFVCIKMKPKYHLNQLRKMIKVVPLHFRHAVLFPWGMKVEFHSTFKSSSEWIRRYWNIVAMDFQIQYWCKKKFIIWDISNYEKIKNINNKINSSIINFNQEYNDCNIKLKMLGQYFGLCL